MAKKKKVFPAIKKKNEGKFSAWAKRKGFSDTCSAADAVMRNQKKYSDTIVKQANYAKNFGCSMKKK
tara:strand:+ start:4432 stop:4632 length:201 start_codon:yes stop_codon:yes gene_type:complete